MIVLVSIDPEFKFSDTEEFSVTPMQLKEIIDGAVSHDLLGFRSSNFGHAYLS